MLPSFVCLYTCTHQGSKTVDYNAFDFQQLGASFGLDQVLNRAPSEYLRNTWSFCLALTCSISVDSVSCCCWYLQAQGDIASHDSQAGIDCWHRSANNLKEISKADSNKVFSEPLRI
jgi:hypothetical protein